MKKKFKDTKFGKALKSKTAIAIKDFAIGLVMDPLKIGVAPIIGTVIGAAEGLNKSKTDNKESAGGGYGKTNYARLAGLLVFVALGLSYILGWIDQSTFEVMFNRLIELLGS